MILLVCLLTMDSEANGLILIKHDMEISLTSRHVLKGMGWTYQSRNIWNILALKNLIYPKSKSNWYLKGYSL